MDLIPDTKKHQQAESPAASQADQPPAGGLGSGSDTPVAASSAETAAVSPPSPVRPREPENDIAAALREADGDNLDAAVEDAMKGVSASEIADSTRAAEVVTDEVSVGAIVSGRIANIGTEDILVDFGAKSLGAMPLTDFRRGESYNLGDTIEVCVVGTDPRGGLLKVSMREARRVKLMSGMRVGLVVEGKVTGMNKGGLDMDVEGVRAFIPASQVDLHFMKDISDLIGQMIRAEVTKFEVDTGDLVVSRRKCLLHEQAERKQKLFAELEVGQIRRGKVRSLTDYGAFVDIGGIDGLLHISDMSWGRTGKPEDLLKVGDELDVKVLKLNSEKRKISLGLKQITTNPWETAETRYVPGATIKGRVVRLASFGAFVELEPGLDALLPISEMSWTRRVRHPSEVVKEGDIVDVGVVSVDTKAQRIALSLKQLRDDPWSNVESKYLVNGTVKGKVVRTTDFGAFVELEEGVDGLIHISELANERVRSVTDKVKPGQEVEVRVLGVDSDARRISLSMRSRPAELSAEEAAAGTSSREAPAKKRPSKPRRGGLTFGWDSQGLGQINLSQLGD